MIAFVKGSFKKNYTIIYTTEKDFSTAEINLWIGVSSITTWDEKRDEQLNGPDFFDTLNHKQITFVSDSIEKMDSLFNNEICGNLTIKGLTKHVKLIVQFGGVEKTGFTVGFSINRSEYGLSWNGKL